MSEPKFESAVRGMGPAVPAPGVPQAGLTETASFSAAAQVAGTTPAAAQPRPARAELRAASPQDVIVPVADIPEAPGWALVLVAIALAAWFLRRHG